MTHSTTKSEFLTAFGFPGQWLDWSLYPDELFAGQLALCIKDRVEAHPDEHLRYGAFLWWLRTHPLLPETTLQALVRLAALDPDPPMSGAAARDILLHPCATEEIADELATLAESQPGWRSCMADATPREFFHRTLREGQQLWLERRTTHRVLADYDLLQLSIDELCGLFALQLPLVSRALVEHPNLPTELLTAMTTMESSRFAKEIRTISRLRLDDKPIPQSSFRDQHMNPLWT